jgi:hypothetical protein
MTLWVMHDQEPRGVFPVSEDEARRRNAEGFGVFFAVQEFSGARRIENLVRIRSWSVDIDGGDKEAQKALIESSPLVPSRVVETKNGYHVHFHAKDARPEHWQAIVLERLVPFFGADPRARDLARILRVPGYLHLKDPANPFLVTERWSFPVSYTERQMAAAFRWVPSEQEKRKEHVESRPEYKSPQGGGEDFWDAVYNLDARESLSRLSGHWSVGGEKYTFRQVRSGNWNVLVDGKSTSCFIDSAGHIGSFDKGGPTPAQWLRYFRHDWKVVVEVLKEIHPHLVEIDERNKQRRAA